MFRELDYQTKVFDAIDHYLDVLNDRKANADEVAKVKAEKPDIDIPDPDFPAETFDRLKAERCLPVSVTRDAEFSSRFDGIGRPVPNITLKVPTGGGKTWIAVKAADKIMNKYLHRNFGFVLWIVPNEAIYTQTLKNFRNREHPYRLALDRASGTRVKILEKTDSLNAADVDTHLCVMVLMLQSSNRQNKETLRIFRDRGDVHGFLPHEGEQDKHKQLLTEIPNLDCYEGHQLAKAKDNASTAEMIQRGDPGLLFTHIKDSLGNALRLIQPVVVMDEGHKAVSELAHNTLYDFNPSFVLELTATPKDVKEKSSKMRYANLLVEVTGKELDAEGMIKMPLVLTASNQQDWKPVLNAAVDKLNSLRTVAETFQADKNRYIRPILLVQVERTGRDTRDGAHIHAEDVRDWLLQTGFDEAEIAIKTADQNDLKQPENQNLLTSESPCRVIITKEALKEGWDCPFAYILCSLASYSNLSAMTQLVGRILRQPQALKTDIQDLDQAYIFTHRSETANIVRQVRAGLEKDGLGDLDIRLSDAGVSEANQKGIVRRIERQAAFKNTQIVLPKLLVKSDRVLRELDYETDILTQTDWSGFDPSPVADALFSGGKQAHKIVRHIGLESDHLAAVLPELRLFDPVLAVRRISDIVLNPFVARDIVGKLINAFKAKGYDSLSMGAIAADIVDTLNTALKDYQNAQAEHYFKAAVMAGNIQFRLRVDGNNWQLPTYLVTTESTQAHQVLNEKGEFLSKNLFSVVYASDMNESEQEVAVWLDGQDNLGWWHRNIARHHYRLQGWQKKAIYPDFVFSVLTDGQTKRLCVLEMKGDHLAGNERTEYIHNVLSFLTDNFSWDNTQPAGQLELENKGETVTCGLVLFNGWKNNLPAFLN